MCTAVLGRLVTATVDGFGLKTVAKLTLAPNTTAMTALCQPAVTQLTNAIPGPS